MESEWRIPTTLYCNWYHNTWQQIPTTIAVKAKWRFKVSFFTITTDPVPKIISLPEKVYIKRENLKYDYKLNERGEKKNGKENSTVKSK